MSPPSGNLKYLAGIGRAIYEGMAKADPKAVWLLQGWTFMNQAHFWKPDRIKAFLGAVPNDHMLVLDLFCERTPVWNTTQGFYGKPWVWSFVYNFGDTTVLGGSGPLERLNDLAAARKHPLGQKVRGVGMMMEGYGHSPLVFDLMYEMAWRDDLDLAAWMREYPRFRYGRNNADAESAWQVLRTGVYNRGIGGQTILTAFPAAGRHYTRYPATVAKAWQLLLRAGKDLGGTETYRHDLVNIARQALSNHAGQLYARTVAAYNAQDAAAYRRSSQEFLQLIYDINELLATNDEFLLGPWIEDAKRWGRTGAERDRLEWNARRVLTLWGRTPALRLRLERMVWNALRFLRETLGVVLPTTTGSVAGEQALRPAGRQSGIAQAGRSMGRPDPGAIPRSPPATAFKSQANCLRSTCGAARPSRA